MPETVATNDIAVWTPVFFAIGLSLSLALIPSAIGQFVTRLCLIHVHWRLFADRQLSVDLYERWYKPTYGSI